MTHPAPFSSTNSRHPSRMACLGTTALCALALSVLPGTVGAQTIVGNGVTLDTTGSPEANGVVVNGTGTLIVGAGGQVSEGGSAPNPLIVNGQGAVTIQAGGVVSGTTTQINNASSFLINAGGRLESDLNADGYIGNLAISGTVTGTVTLTGTMDFSMDGTIEGDLIIADSARPITLTPFALEGTIGGNMTAASIDMETTGTLNVGGDLTLANYAVMDVAGGDLIVGGDIFNTGFSTIQIQGGRTVGVGGGTGTLTNAGNLVFEGAGGMVDGNVLNQNRIVMSGTSGRITGNLVGAAGSQIDMRDGIAGDTLTINGDMAGTNLLYLDIDLTTENAGFSDMVIVDGTVSGDIGINFTPVGGVLTLQENPITIIDGGALDPNVNVQLAGLPQAGLIVFGLGTEGDDIVLRTGVTTELGSVAGSIGVVQGIIGSIVNRPSSAFVSGIAFEAENNCSTGAWARFNAGETSTEATSTSRNTGISTRTGVNVRHGGIQGGVDFGCFNSFDGGWDISGGLLFGHNRGKIRADNMTGDFSQGFLGVYMNVAKDDFSGELQLREERTTFEFRNPGLGLDDKMSSRTTTFSGSASYRFALDDGWAVIPTAGLSIAHTRGGVLNFTGAAAGQLRPGSYTNRLGFVGVTLGRTVVLDDTSALNMFSTLTTYRNFSGDRTTTFTAGGANDVLSTRMVKNYHEVSLGLNYINVLEGVTSGIRQVNANLRADYRFGTDLKSAGITAQLRLQF